MATKTKTVDVTLNYKPHAKQLLLHNVPATFEDLWICLFGGSRGGGKSAGMLMDAVMFATTYPNAKICILRENLDAVRQSFLDKLPTLFPEVVGGVRMYEYKEKSSSWYPSRSLVFPNGSYITLQRVANLAEAKAKQGWEFNMLIIDEITKQDEATFNYLRTCVRSTIVRNPYTGKTLKIPQKILLGCNPNGPGFKWVKERFINRAVVEVNEHGTPIKTKDFIELVENPIRKGEYIKVFYRFIPATYSDNPYLSPAYVANLMNLPEHLKKGDLYGSWDIVAGQMFDLHPEQKVKPREAKLILDTYGAKVKIPIYISIDWGFRPSYHSAHWYAILPDHRILVFKELYGQELIFEDFVKIIDEYSDGLDIEATCLPHDMFRQGDRYRDDSGKIIGETKSDVFEFHNLQPIPVESGKGKVKMRYDKIHSAMELKNSDGVYKVIISTACPMLIEELEMAVYSDLNPEDLADGCRDHALDDFGLFLVMYSDDIEPLGYEIVIPDNRSRLQRMLDEDERLLEEQEEDNYYIGVDNYYDY